ncbi:Zn-ribbon domain-containing OB-fold protein [Agrococcus baldri]|uniref:DNA-binding protein n=1 Tax=Agrococcus baldri TaxID=153730 RepID=A0AA87REQ9_9MICO|nr:OB-fold domain-containing protein [Agrococcus baldri]GEK79105.1 hypothetical protein ABA31_04560 [Agrococcus baldri]
MDKQTEEFRSGLRQGELLIQRCEQCSRLNMYPKFACPFCQSEELGWAQAAGTGSLYAFTVCRLASPAGFEEELPYALAIVKLDEGVQLLGRLTPDEDGEWNGYALDTPVEFVTAGSTGEGARPIAWFSRAGSSAA